MVDTNLLQKHNRNNNNTSYYYCPVCKNEMIQDTRMISPTETEFIYHCSTDVKHGIWKCVNMINENPRQPNTVRTKR